MDYNIASVITWRSPTPCSQLDSALIFICRSRQSRVPALITAMLSGHPARRQFAAYRRSHSSPPTMAHQKRIRDGNLCQAPYATVGIPLAGRNNRLAIPSSLALQTDRQRRRRSPSLIAKPVTVLSGSSTFGKPLPGRRPPKPPPEPGPTWPPAIVTALPTPSVGPPATP